MSGECKVPVAEIPKGKGIWAHLTLFRDYLIYTQKYQMGQSQVLGSPREGLGVGKVAERLKMGGGNEARRWPQQRLL